MSRELAEYLDVYRPDPRSGLGTGVVPLLPGSLPRITVPLTVSAPAPTQSPAQKSAIDAAMWTLDQQWSGSGTWTSMKSCVRVKDFNGGFVSTPWAQLGSDGCRNWAGSVANPTCLWGFWRIDRCDLPTATELVFQFARYLWAQGRMRELLATKPGDATGWSDAAFWAWKAAELISVLQWSTNVRFDNPNAMSGAGDYAADLKRAGLLWSPPAGANLGFAYDGPALSKAPYFVPYTLTPRALNVVGETRVIPLQEQDFAPGDGPLAFMDRSAPPQTHPMFAIATPSGPAPYYSNVPIGISNEQADDIRNRTLELYLASHSSPDSLRWASTRAFNEFWFRATWTWPTWWVPVTDVYTRVVRHVSDGTPAGHTEYGWSAQPQTMVLGGARLAVELLAQQLSFYSDKSAPTANYLAWMQTALSTYNVDTAGIGSDNPAAIDFNRAKSALLSSVNAAATQAGSIARSGTAAGGDAAAYTAVTASLVQAVWSLAAQSVPLLGTIYSALNQAVQWFAAAAGGAVGNIPCPAFPFIRVMAPSSGGCAVATSDIVSSLLGISTSATWPIAIGGLTRSFVVDAVPFNVTFQAGDSTPDAVARRINAAAALVGLGPVASVANGQVHVQGSDPAAGPAVATGGTAASLRFPGPTTVVQYSLAPSQTANTTSAPAAKSSSSAPWLVGAALLAWRFLR